MKKDGIIVFHDSHWKEGVRKFVDSLKLRSDYVWNVIKFDWYFGVTICQRGY